MSLECGSGSGMSYRYEISSAEDTCTYTVLLMPGEISTLEWLLKRWLRDCRSLLNHGTVLKIECNMEIQGSTALTTMAGSTRSSSSDEKKNIDDLWQNIVRNGRSIT